MYLEEYSFNRDESHMTFREEKLVNFSDNHVSIELGNTYIHTYIQTLLKLPKWVFQFNTIKTYKLKFKVVKNISTIIL